MQVYLRNSDPLNGNTWWYFAIDVAVI